MEVILTTYYNWDDPPSTGTGTLWGVLRLFLVGSKDYTLRIQGTSITDYTLNPILGMGRLRPSILRFFGTGLDFWEYYS